MLSGVRGVWGVRGGRIDYMERKYIYNNICRGSEVSGGSEMAYVGGGGGGRG